MSASVWEKDESNGGSDKHENKRKRPPKEPTYTSWNAWQANCKVAAKTGSGLATSPNKGVPAMYEAVV